MMPALTMIDFVNSIKMTIADLNPFIATSNSLLMPTFDEQQKLFQTFSSINDYNESTIYATNPPIYGDNQQITNTTASIVYNETVQYKEFIYDRTDVRVIFITLYSLVFCCCFFGKFNHFNACFAQKTIKTLVDV